MEAIYQQINAGASCTMQFQIRGCTLRGVSVNFIFFLQNDKIYCQCLNHELDVSIFFNMQTTRPALRKRDFFKNSNSRKEKSDK